MQGSQVEGDDGAPRPIGKKELLLWATEVTGISCSKFEDLRDGVVIMRLMSSIWPRAVDPRNSRKMKAAPQMDWELKRNWDTIKEVMGDIRLPVQLVDRTAIQQGRFRACYNLLVMLFFMMSLTRHREFSVDFAHPIDPRLSAFLQSNASIDALSRGGALSVQPSDTDDGDDSAQGIAQPSTRNAVGQTLNPAATDAASPTPPLVSLLGLSREARGARLMPTDASASLPAAVSPTYAANSLAQPSNIHHTLPPSASSGHPPHHTSHPPLPSLSNTAAFAAVELSVIQLIESSPNLDLEWAEAVSPESPNAMPLAAATSWLQSKFPALCHADAIRLAFQRAAQSSDSFTAECRGSDGALQPGDLADFIMRALYCHRVYALCDSVRAAAGGKSSPHRSAHVSEELFVETAAFSTAGGEAAARDIFQQLCRRQNSGHSASKQAGVPIALVCDWLLDENTHNFPVLSSARDHVRSHVHGPDAFGIDRIQVSNAMSVSANLVSVSSTPVHGGQPSVTSHPSAVTTPGPRSYTGAYSATPQSARAASHISSASRPSSSADVSDALHGTRGQDSLLDANAAAVPVAPAAEGEEGGRGGRGSDSKGNAKSIDSQTHHPNQPTIVNNISLAPPALTLLPAVSQSQPPPQALHWKSAALQEQGEKALAQLKVENESLHRQLRLQREESSAQKARFEQQIDQQRQQAVLEAAVSSSRVSGLEAQLASSAAAHEARLRRELALAVGNWGDQMRLVKDLGSSAIQREFDDSNLESVVLSMKQQQLHLQAQVAHLQRSINADHAAVAAAEASVEDERKRVRELETKVAAAIALPTAALNVAKLINAVIVEHPGGGALTLRERRFVSIIEAMELEITEMHIASDAMIEAFNVSRISSASPDSKQRSALEGYEEQRELLAMRDKLSRAEQKEQYLAAQVTELTRVLDLERLGAGPQNDWRSSLQRNAAQQESPHKPDAASPFSWLSQAPGPGEQERLSRNSAVVKALETAISCIPDTQKEMASLKSQLKAALMSFWQMEVESLLLRRRLFQTSALIETSADRLHAREKLLSQELAACRDRHDDAVNQLREAHLNQCLQLSKQAALFQVQSEIKDIIAQEMKLERDAAYEHSEKCQAAACHSSITAFKTMHTRLVAIAQEAARLRLRDQLWMRLIQVQREAISLHEHRSNGDAPGLADVLKLRQILEHQASVIANEINSINESPPPAASPDILDAGRVVAEATATLSEMQAAVQASLAQARAALDEKRQHIEKVLLDCSQFETMALHESQRRSAVEEKLGSYAEECSYLRRTLGSAMGAASRDEILAEVQKIKDAEESAAQQLLRGPPGSSLDAIIEEDSSFEPSFLLSPKGEGQPGNTGHPGDSNGSHALNGSIEDGIEF